MCFYTGVCFFFAKKLMTVLYLSWSNGFTDSGHVFCWLPQVVATTQKLFCLKMSASCFKVLGTKQGHCLCLFAQTLPWIVRLDLSALGACARLQLFEPFLRFSMWAVSLRWNFTSEWAFFCIASGFSQCLTVRCFGRKSLLVCSENRSSITGAFLGNTSKHTIWTLPTSRTHEIQSAWDPVTSDSVWGLWSQENRHCEPDHPWSYHF